MAVVDSKPHSGAEGFQTWEEDSSCSFAVLVPWGTKRGGHIVAEIEERKLSAIQRSEILLALG